MREYETVLPGELWELALDNDCLMLSLNRSRTTVSNKCVRQFLRLDGDHAGSTIEFFAELSTSLWKRIA